MFPSASKISPRRGEKSRSSTAKTLPKDEKPRLEDSSLARSPIRGEKQKSRKAVITIPASPPKEDLLVIDNDVVFIHDEPTTSTGVTAKKMKSSLPKGNNKRAPSLFIEKEVQLTKEEAAALKRAEKAEKKSKLAESFKLLKSKLEKSVEREKVTCLQYMKKQMFHFVFSGKQEEMGLTPECGMQLLNEVRACELINTKFFTSSIFLLNLLLSSVFQASYVNSLRKQSEAIDIFIFIFFVTANFVISNRCNVLLIH